MQLEVTDRGGLHVPDLEFRTTYCPGCVESRTSIARTRSPISASRDSHSATCPWNCGSSGCVAYGASDELIRYIEMS